MWCMHRLHCEVMHGSSHADRYSLGSVNCSSKILQTFLTAETVFDAECGNFVAWLLQWILLLHDECRVVPTLLQPAFTLLLNTRACGAWEQLSKE